MIRNHDGGGLEGEMVSPSRFTGCTPPKRGSPVNGNYKIGALVLLAVGHLVLTFWFIAPGALLSDEAIYHWMAKSFAETRSFTVWNGYEEIPSRELQHRYMRPYHGELNPQYPPLFTILALPFYRVFGFFGLFVMNALAFMGVVALCFVTARRLFKDEDLALNACFILTLGTFAWEYSQAAWPHIFALLFFMAAFYLSQCASAADTATVHLERGNDSESRWGRHGGGDGRPLHIHREQSGPKPGERLPATRHAAILPALAAGFVGATGMGVRLDNVLVFPALVLPFLFAKQPRPWEALAVILGAAPPLLLLAAANYVRFGDFNPFSYGEGPGVQTISPWLVVALLVVLLVAWAVTRPRFVQLPARARIIVWATVGLGTLCAVAVVPEAMGRVFHDGYVCTVDVRALPLDSTVAPRSSGGGVLYIGAHKKALLQSLPYLPLLLLPVLGILSRSRDFPALATLFLPVLTVIGFYSYSFPFHDMGGLCLNTRYFIPCLPFVAILCAYGIKDLEIRWGTPVMTVPKPDSLASPVVSRISEITLVAVALVVVGAFFVFTRKLSPGLDALEFPLLALPLYWALLLLVLLGCGLLVTAPWVRWIRGAAWMVMFGAMVWAGVVALWYDYPAHRFVRVVHWIYGQKLLESISPESIVFADNKTFTMVMNAIEKPRARVAFPPEDRFEDFSRLLDFQLKEGRRAFAFFHDALWAELRVGLLASYRITPLVVFDGFALAEISAEPAK